MPKTRNRNNLAGFAFPKTYRKATSERRGPGPEWLLEKQVLAWAALQPDVYLRKVSVGMIPGSRGGFRPNPSVGMADLIGVCRGRALAFELKSPVGRTTPAQDEFLRNWQLRDGIACVIRSLDEVICVIESLRRDKNLTGPHWTIPCTTTPDDTTP